MIKETVSINDVIELLNDATKRDPDAIARLVNFRTLCNELLSDHPTIQVSSDGGKFSVGLLGIINGIFGIDDKGWGVIAAVFNVDCPKGKYSFRSHEEFNIRMERSKKNVGDACPCCGATLVLGELIEFKRLEQ